MTTRDGFDRFSIKLFLDDEEDWVAHFVELPNVSAAGKNPETALHELEQAWLAMRESYIKHNEPIPLAPAKKRNIAVYSTFALISVFIGHWLLKLHKQECKHSGGVTRKPLPFSDWNW